MFPQGWPGAGLLLLRAAVAGGTALGLDVAGLSLPPALPWCIAALLLFGALTPLACLLCCLLAIGVLSQADWGATATTALLTGLSAAALALLGPGAFSLDSALFGRRRLILPGRDP
jgi:hypothetical protein